MDAARKKCWPWTLHMPTSWGSRVDTMRCVRLVELFMLRLGKEEDAAKGAAVAEGVTLCLEGEEGDVAMG